MELYRVEHLSFSYPVYETYGAEKKSEDRRQPEAVSDCSFCVEEGSFVTLCGETGSGKSTLLRLLKKELQPEGTQSGRILYLGKPLSDYAYGETAAEIGFVMQNPDDQPVTDRVWHELAFGLENMGLRTEEIRRRVAETAGYFGIGGWYERPVAELSGGQKQLLNLAAVMAMEPKVLLLDEPTAQLDPIAARNFMNRIVNVNRELGVTVLLAEHRLEEALPVSDRVLVLGGRRLICEGTPEQVVRFLPREAAIYRAFPIAARLYRELTEKDACGEGKTAEEGACGENQAAEKGTCGESQAAEKGTCGEGKAAEESADGESQALQGRGAVQKNAAAKESVQTENMPLTVSEGKRWLRQHAPGREKEAGADQGEEGAGKKTDGRTVRPGKEAPVLELKQVFFRYERHAADVLRGTELAVRRGETVGLFGGNGSGKTTLLRLIAGMERPQAGRIKRGVSRVGYLPQDIETLFAADTVEKELRLSGAAPTGRLLPYADCHPYDLSGGEKQLLAWEKVLAGKPELLLLDEPTKGLDVSGKEEIARRVRALAGEGVTILLATHDAELAAACCSRCGLLFQGELAVFEETRRFFEGNHFYTTAAARLAQGIFDHVLTDEELFERCRG